MGVRKKLELLKYFGTIEKLYNAKEKELQQVKGIGEKSAQTILNPKIREEVDNHIKYMLNNKIDIISIEDSEYPNLLKQIYDPPICLYIIGNKHILNQTSISIVGCRQCSEYGRTVAGNLSYNLARNDINIVSGLAKGIDAISHQGAIMAGGKTIAVLGNGLDKIYPKENLNLARQILAKGGTIISEYPLGQKPEKQNFPERNRIVSGIANGVIVVEAKEKSGTLITVDFALEQGRDVFVVPGNINSENSVGTNELIKQGAKIITSYKDLLEEYRK